MAETRKIAAILAGDVVDFSRIASADADRTLARSRTLRAEFIDPRVASQNGRAFKRIGATFLASTNRDCIILARNDSVRYKVERIPVVFDAKHALYRRETYRTC